MRRMIAAAWAPGFLLPPSVGRVSGKGVGPYAPSPRWLGAAAPGGLADVERDLIRTRTAEGRSRAKAQGL
jgi:hypothetical protein